MGSYGIGISRIPAAAIELSNDNNGIIWPKALSPFSVHLINLNIDDSECSEFCEKLYTEIKERNIDIIVVGTGLAGGSACATLAELGYNVKAFCFQDSPRRAHSIAAQGGINAVSYTHLTLPTSR